jgi:hypothetical protein
MAAQDVSNKGFQLIVGPLGRVLYTAENDSQLQFSVIAIKMWGWVVFGVSNHIEAPLERLGYKNNGP